MTRREYAATATTRCQTHNCTRFREMQIINYGEIEIYFALQHILIYIWLFVILRCATTDFCLAVWTILQGTRQ